MHGSAHAQSPLNEQDIQIRHHSETIKKTYNIPPLPINKYTRYAEEQAQQSIAISETYNQASAIKTKSRLNQYLIFVSFSLGESQLLNLLEHADEHCQVVFIGVTKEYAISETLLKLQRLVIASRTTSDVVINPTLFRKYNVKNVPTIVHRHSDDGTYISRVTGLITTNWLADKIEKGDQGDYGKRGPTYPILEEDLIELMKRRLLKIDFTQKKQKALKRFWQTRKYYDIPRAIKPRKRNIDPSIKVIDHIMDANNQIIVPKNKILNPLHQKSFHQAILIFNPLLSEELQFVKKEITRLSVEHSQITLIATQLDSPKGWAGYNDLTQQLDAHVYLLNKEIKDRFQIEYTPTLVTANNDNFIVQEFKITPP
ncbi:MAG: TrbC family F-type conjugative pilus assembly protein [Candidatus Thiodiazotropha endolucinida]|nr:hypothetical protein [Candidatus Thiodiazotropha taylori]MCW4223828.1 TrbC family F-type conjugative pilus assembly protein [Candidatus Thiodiazotropha endolucinida]MCW4332338.1 TrbC family F-type conjugative pilus assembly protein [Candidatus Thiodiazotropha endolucinida]